MLSYFANNNLSFLGGHTFYNKTDGGFHDD